MASRIYNRSPLQFNLPSEAAIRNYFFDHNNWKGVNENKNFLVVDQETFADANNIYVNGEGILRSRPSIKILNDDIFKDIDVKDVQSINGATVIRYSDTDGNHMKVVFKGNTSSITLENINATTLTSDNKIYVFDTNTVYVFSFEDNAFDDGLQYLYIPRRTIYANKQEDGESENILTDSFSTVYHYNNTYGMPIGANGKNLSASVNGTIVNVVWDSDSSDLMVSEKGVIPDYNLKNITVSSKGNYCVLDYRTGELLFSENAYVFRHIDTVYPNIHGRVIAGPKFSHDGNYVTICTEPTDLGGRHTIWIIAVHADTNDGRLRFSELTDIESASYQEIVGGSYGMVGYDIAADFITYDNFAFAQLKSFETGLKAYMHVVNNHSTKFTEQTFDNDVSLSQLFYSGTDVVLVAANVEPGNVNPGGVVVITNGTNVWKLDNFKQFKTNFHNVDCNWASGKILLSFNDSVPAEDTPDGFAYFVRLTYQSGNFVIDRQLSVEHNGAGVVYISPDGMKALMADGIFNIESSTFKPLLFTADHVITIGYNAYPCYAIVDSSDALLYDGGGEIAVDFEYLINGKYIAPNISHIAELSNTYIAIGNKIYISEYRTNYSDKFAWYFPKNKVRAFEFDVTGLCAISTNEIAVFGKNELWYLSETDNGIRVVKSKVDAGLENGSDVVKVYEGTQTMFATKRGFVSLAYQDFVASTDQELTVLSDPIYARMRAFVMNPVKLFKYDHWILLYNGFAGYLLDVRNGSWWPMTCHIDLAKVFEYNDKIALLSNGKLYYLDTSDAEYFDFDGSKISWYFTSQKLHFGQLNYYKHISNITLVSNIDSDEEITHNLDIVNYRKTLDSVTTKNIAYKVEVVRTYVQRLNHSKVNEFQYTMSSDFENAIQLPLSLSDISIKYKITGQVR